MMKSSYLKALIDHYISDINLADCVMTVEVTDDEDDVDTVLRDLQTPASYASDLANYIMSRDDAAKDFFSTRIEALRQELKQAKAQHAKEVANLKNQNLGLLAKIATMLPDY